MRRWLPHTFRGAHQVVVGRHAKVVGNGHTFGNCLLKNVPAVAGVVGQVELARARAEGECFEARRGARALGPGGLGQRCGNGGHGGNKEGGKRKLHCGRDYSMDKMKGVLAKRGEEGCG